MDIYTIGHSTHSPEEFTSMLRAHHIEILVDVRSYPGSRRCPHFGKESMQLWLDIEYNHMPELGGRRRKSLTVNESLVAGWTHVSFRNYAAYTFSNEYEEGITRLLKIAENRRTAYMCSESLPWKCHRSIISNTLTARGIKVWHIMSETKTDLHILGKYGATPVIEKDKIIYPEHHVVQTELPLD